VRLPALAVAMLALGACVATPAGDDDPTVARSVVVQLPNAVAPTEAPLVEFYHGLLQRLRDAYQDGRLAELQQLLQSYRRDDAPEFARASMDSFVTAALGLQFELHCQGNVRLEPPSEPQPIGNATRLLLRLPPLAGHNVLLLRSSGKEPTAIGLHFGIEDTLLDGSVRAQTVNETLRLPRDVVLGAGSSVLELPFELGADPSSAIRRRLTVTVSLLPGYVQVDGVSAPVRRTALSTVTLQQYPAGSDPIRAEPLRTLRAAMALGDAPHLPHVLLATMFAGPAEQETMLPLLVQWVRNGHDDQKTVAMAGLKELTGQPFAVGDRQRWLQWWQERR
jgi:hypothetical protein